MKRIATSQQQDGFVSIIVALFVMIFVSLLALGFAFLARENAEQNQNRVLSTQAFYAAESGVNDVVDYLKATPAAAAKKTTCPAPGSYSSDIGSTNTEVKYTCVLYDKTPTSLVYSVGNDDSSVAKVQTSGTAISSITISWQDAQGSTDFANNSQHYLPENSATSPDVATGDNLKAGTGILRATIIPFYNTTTSRGQLTDTTETLFLYPNKNGTATTAFNAANTGMFLDGNCDKTATPKYCNVTITGLPASKTFYIRLRSLYRPLSSVMITAKDNTGTALSLVNEQAIIDSTGKANNVVRRIQVRVPLTSTAQHPEYAIETVDSLCKRLEVWPGGASIDDDAIPSDQKAACQTH